MRARWCQGTESGVGRAVIALLLALAVGGCAEHQKGVPRPMRAWNRPAEAFRVVGNIHFVGTSDIGIYLITTPAGHILLDSGFEGTVGLVRAGVERLGFRLQDVKLLLTSHAHVDHVAGHALMRELTGARVLASRADAAVIEAGGKGDFTYDGIYEWRPCTVDQVVEEGAVVELGGTRLTAHLTPGHTKGAITWTMDVDDDRRRLRVLFFPSGNLNPGVPVRDNPKYPTMADDYRRSFARWLQMPCDVFLAAHGNFFDLWSKRARQKEAARPNPFIDPAGFRRVVREQEARFLEAVRE